MMDGQGVSAYPDGTYYAGEYKNGKKDGKGVHTNVDGVKTL